MALQKFALLFDVKETVISDATLQSAYGEIPIFRVSGQHIDNDRAGAGVSNAMRLYGYDPVDTTRDLLVQWDLRNVLLRHTKNMDASTRDAIMNHFPGWNGGTQWLYGGIPRGEFSDRALERVANFEEVHKTLSELRAANPAMFTSGGKTATRTDRFYGKGVSYNQDGFSRANLEKYIDTATGKSLYDTVGNLYNIPGFQCLGGLFLLCESRTSTKHGGSFYVVTEYENLSKLSLFGGSGAKKVNLSANNAADTSADFTPPVKVATQEVDFPTFVNMVTLAGVDASKAQAEGVVVNGVKYLLKV